MTKKITITQTGALLGCFTSYILDDRFSILSCFVIYFAFVIGYFMCYYQVTKHLKTNQNDTRTTFLRNS